MIKLFICLISLLGTYSYIPTLHVRKYTRKFSNLNDVTVFEPIKCDRKEMSCVIYFTGGNALMPADIYSDFLEKLSSRNIAVYVPILGNCNYEKLLKKLRSEYKDLTFIGHSSGGTAAIKKAIGRKYIKNLILLDSVDTRLLDSNFRGKKYKLKNLRNLVFLNAEKTYKVSFDPFGLPFIPFLSLNEMAFELCKYCKIKEFKALKYGHGDVLNLPFSNFLHNSRIAVGYKERKSEYLKSYYNWLSKVIYLTIKNRLNEKNNYNEIDYI